MELLHLPGKLDVAQSVIRFLLNNRAMTVDDVAPTMSVLEYLRQRTACMGTKEGCAEGDCGACTVVIGECRHGEIVMKTVNACIRFMPTLQGKALFTVEYLRGENGRLHPVQQAMVDCHASQCGFCTPGFVMSLWGLYINGAGSKNANETDDTSVRRAITGNLCRCTGYRPIIEAGKRMFDMPTIHFDRIALAQMLASLTQAQTTQGTCYENQGRRFFMPRTLAELIKLRSAFPESTILAGGTDIGLWVNKQFRELGHIIYLGQVAQLQRIERRGNALEIGAGASLTHAWDALAHAWPTLREMGLRFASPPVRNAGTLGGNLANGSPIGDCAPVLMALGASLVLRRAGATRSLMLDDFYTGYLTNRLLPGEFVQAVVVPIQCDLSATGASQIDRQHNVQTQRLHHLRAYKLSKRFDSDISALAAGLWLSLDGDIVSDARFAFGGMAERVRRATLAEAAVRGQPWSQATVRAAMHALDADFQPLGDLRASASYRQRAARNLLQRFWLETRADAPLPASAISVWEAR